MEGSNTYSGTGATGTVERFGTLREHARQADARRAAVAVYAPDASTLEQLTLEAGEAALALALLERDGGMWTPEQVDLVKRVAKRAGLTS